MIFYAHSKESTYSLYYIHAIFLKEPFPNRNTSFDKNVILKCFLLKLKNVEEKEGEQEGHCASEIKM